MPFLEVAVAGQESRACCKSKIPPRCNSKVYPGPFHQGKVLPGRYKACSWPSVALCGETVFYLRVSKNESYGFCGSADAERGLNQNRFGRSQSRPISGRLGSVTCEDIRQEFGIAGASNDVLLQRASIRQTNKEALGEIATNLLEAGRYTLLQGIRVIDISRADLAARKNQFAWGQSDLPPMLGVLERDLTNVTAGKFEVEKSKVDTEPIMVGNTVMLPVVPGERR
jgi:hypothetical protein